MMINKLKSILSCLLVFAVLLPIGYIPKSVYAQEADTLKTPGWYLESYKLVINTKQTLGTFSQGGNYKDIVKIFDLEGNEMQGLESDFENDIMLSYGRYGEDDSYLCGYGQNISWDSPEDYYAAGSVISLAGISNQEVSHQTWNCRKISARFNVQTIHDTYDYRFLDTDKNDQFGIGTADATVTTDKAIPKAVRGDKAYLVINFDYSTSADSQAIYTYVWKAPDNPVKEKDYKVKAVKKGWYLTGYQFEYYENMYYESTFGDGSLCVDTVSAYDENGDKGGKELENDIYISKERFIGAYKPESFCIGVRSEVKWDSPANYIAAGGSIVFKNYSNIILASTDTWGAQSTHWYAGTTGFSTEIADAGGNSWPAATEPITMKSVSALPEGTKDQELKVYFEISTVGKAVYTYTWKTGEQAAPTLAKSKITLYLVGSNQKLTYQIEVKNSEGYTITYKSRKASVASVNKSGLITAKKSGTANIVVTFKKDGKIINKTIKAEVKKK